MERLPATLDPFSWYAIRVVKNFGTDAERVIVTQSTSGTRVPEALRSLRQRYRAATLDVVPAAA